MRKLLSAGVISLTLLAGSALAYVGQDWNHHWDEHRRVTVERTNDNGYRRHARIIRTRDGRIMIVHRRHARVDRYYYDRHHRMP